MISLIKLATLLGISGLSVTPIVVGVNVSEHYYKSVDENTNYNLYKFEKKLELPKNIADKELIVGDNNNDKLKDHDIVIGTNIYHPSTENDDYEKNAEIISENKIRNHQWIIDNCYNNKNIKFNSVYYSNDNIINFNNYYLISQNTIKGDNLEDYINSIDITDEDESSFIVKTYFKNKKGEWVYPSNSNSDFRYIINYINVILKPLWPACMKIDPNDNSNFIVNKWSTIKTFQGIMKGNESGRDFVKNSILNSNTYKIYFQYSPGNVGTNYLKNKHDHDRIFSYFGMFPKFSINDNKLALKYYTFGEAYSYYAEDKYKESWLCCQFPKSDSNFTFTLPYSIEQIQYDLFESKNRIFPDEITISSNESLNPSENIDNFNNVQNSANQIVNNFNTYVKNSNDFAKMGANTNHIMVKNIDYSQLKDNKHFTITLQLSDAFANLIPIADDFMDKEYYKDNNLGNITINNDKNEIKIKIYVKVIPGDDFNGKLSQLISIIPYNSLNNTLMYFDKSKQFFNNDCLILSSKNTNLYLANSEIINLNSAHSLITENKIGFINKYGADVSLSFNLSVNDTIYELDPIELGEIYKYGQYSFQLDLNNVVDSVVVNNKINLKFIYSPNSIEIISDGINQLVNSNPNINLYLTNINIKVANDQNFGNAKWLKISNSPLNQNGEVNNSDVDFGNNQNSNKYYGTYSTNSPFFIKLPEVLVQSVDNSNTLISKYKLFINDEPISSEPGKGFEFDTGNIYRDIMNSNSDELSNLIKIRIYEYDPSSSSENKYTKVTFGLDVFMNVLKDISNYNLKGWNDPNIEAEKEKYFDDQSDYYRPYANKDTGMYFPKVAWVNAPANNSFKYDPVDEDGNLLKGLSANDSDSHVDVDYQTGFIAEINASSFKSGDFSASSLTGAYDISYTNNDFDFTSNIPVVYEYSFANDNFNSTPSINKTLLFQDDSVEINSHNLTQTVLKRNDSDDYTYQFSLFNKNIIDPTTNEQYDLFQLYSSYVNMNNEPLFVDFWTTYHGKNLMNFIQKSQPDFNLESAYELSYLETLSYWDSYIFAKTTSYTSNSLNSYNGINTINYICEDKNKLRQLIIDDIQAKLQEWYQNNVKRKLIYLGVDYMIEDFDGETTNPSPKFDAKIDELIQNYNNNEFKYVTFNVVAIDNSKLTDSTTFKISNYSKFDTLDNLRFKTVRFNSNFAGDKENNKPSFDDSYLGNSKQEKIKNLILNSIDYEIDNKFKKDYVYGVDYRLSFYKTNECNLADQYLDINDAINNCLLVDANSNKFKNSLFVKIEGISNTGDPNHILAGSNVKTFINDCNLNVASENDDTIKDNSIESSSESSSQEWIWIMSVSIAVAIIIVVIITTLVLRHRRKKI